MIRKNGKFNSGALLAAFALTALVAGVVWTDSADAGWFGKKDKGEKERGQTHRYDRYPTLSFTTGTLQRDGRDGWALGNRTLHFVKDATIAYEGQSGGTLQEGREAVVSGTIVGDMIFVTRINVLKPDFNNTTMGEDEAYLIPSTSNPNVGEVSGGPM